MWVAPVSSGSPAHLHLQVYADHRFEREELVNPYGLLVQLCDGKGVTAFHPKIARRQIPAVEVTTRDCEACWLCASQRSRQSTPGQGRLGMVDQ